MEIANRNDVADVSGECKITVQNNTVADGQTDGQYFYINIARQYYYRASVY